MLPPLPPAVTPRVQMLTYFVLKVDVGKTCKLVKRRRGLLYARDPPCFTRAQFPEVGKYNDAYSEVQKQSDVFAVKQIEWVNYEAIRRFDAVDLANAIRVAPIPESADIRLHSIPDSGTLIVVDVNKFTFNEVPPEKGDAASNSEPNSADVNSPEVNSPDANSPTPKTPLTAQTPNTAVLEKLTPIQAKDLYLRQIEAAKKAPGNQISNVLAVQAKWAKYLGIDVDAFIEGKLKVPVEPSSPFLQQPPAEDVGNLPNPQFRLKGAAQQAFEADLKLPPVRQADLNLNSDGPKPKYAADMIAAYQELARLTDVLNKAGDRATRQLEKAARLPDGTLAKWFEDIRQHRYNAELKNMRVPNYIKSGYVVRAEGDKIIVESQPMTKGPKIVIGFGIALVATGVGYEIVEDNTN